MEPIEAISWYCHRYGPGRLPGADRDHIGAGYAAATGALAAALLFAAGTFVAHLLGASLVVAHPFWSALALLATGLVVPVAFVSAVVVWRYSRTLTPNFGAVAGALTVAMTYALSLVATFLAVAAFLMASGATGWVTVATDAAVLSALIAIFALVFTAWFTIPLGIIGGWTYERATRH